MKRILNTALLSSFAAMLFTGVAAAQSAVPTLTFIGSGCPLDADSVNSHWEGSTLVVNFAQMSATKGPGVSLLEGRKTCSLTLDLKVPNGLKYTLVGYTASGYDSLAEGDKRNLSVSSFFQGSSDTATFTNESLGAKEGEFRVRERTE